MRRLSGFFIGTIMGLGYPKIWTSILEEDWFIELPPNGRYLFFMLLLLVKQGTDNGHLTVNSWADLSRRCLLNSKTGTRMGQKLVDLSLVEIVHQSKLRLSLYIPKYNEYQGIKDTKELQKKLKNNNIPKNPKTDKLEENRIEERREEEILSVFNKTCSSLPKIKSIKDTRLRTLKTRIKENPDFDWEAYFKKVETSKFLTGENDRGWVANFDWIINRTNFEKINEGNYDNRENKKPREKSFREQAEEGSIA